MLPEVGERFYQSAAKAWKLHNPNYEVHLWTDRRTYPHEQQAQILADMQRFAEQNQLIFHQVTHGDCYSDAFYEKEAGIEARGPHAPLDANWGAASDILRVNILLDLGGIYVDTDITCTGPLSALPQGSTILCRIEPAPLSTPSNNIIATTRNHPCMVEFRTIQQQAFTLLYNDQPPGIFDLYRTSKGSLESARAAWTMNNTGPMALTDALLRGEGGFKAAMVSHNMQAYEFPMTNITVDYHHSWV